MKPMKKQIFLIAVATAGLFRAQAAIPEPDNVIYGLITLGTNLVTAANTNVLISASAQWNGPAIASYQMGWQPAAGNFYTLRISLESLLPLANPAAIDPQACVANAARFSPAVFRAGIESEVRAAIERVDGPAAATRQPLAATRLVRRAVRDSSR